MSKNLWQLKAPILGVLLATSAFALALWYRSSDRLPHAATELVSPEIVSQSPTAPESTAQATFVKPAIGPEHAHDQGMAGIHSQLDTQAQLRSELEQLEREFLAEPISAAWSTSTEKLIAESLSESGLAVNNAPAPISHESECRSNSCRIRVTYRNDMDAQMGEIFLLGSIANSLPSANFGRLVSPDGTVLIVMYADTGTVKRQR